MTPGIGPEQWERIDRECAYEAEKAVAAADPKTPVSLTARRLFLACVELRGAKYVGRVTTPDQEWHSLVRRCKAEVQQMTFRSKTKRDRDWEPEEAEVACLKRQVAFYP